MKVNHNSHQNSSPKRQNHRRRYNSAAGEPRVNRSNLTTTTLTNASRITTQSQIISKSCQVDILITTKNLIWKKHYHGDYKFILKSFHSRKGITNPQRFSKTRFNRSSIKVNYTFETYQFLTLSIVFDVGYQTKVTSFSLGQLVTAKDRIIKKVINLPEVSGELEISHRPCSANQGPRNELYLMFYRGVRLSLVSCVDFSLLNRPSKYLLNPLHNVKTDCMNTYEKVLAVLAQNLSDYNFGLSQGFGFGARPIPGFGSLGIDNELKDQNFVPAYFPLNGSWDRPMVDDWKKLMKVYESAAKKVEPRAPPSKASVILEEALENVRNLAQEDLVQVVLILAHNTFKDLDRCVEQLEAAQMKVGFMVVVVGMGPKGMEEMEVFNTLMNAQFRRYEDFKDQSGDELSKVVLRTLGEQILDFYYCSEHNRFLSMKNSEFFTGGPELRDFELAENPENIEKIKEPGRGILSYLEDSELFVGRSNVKVFDQSKLVRE